MKSLATAPAAVKCEVESKLSDGFATPVPIAPAVTVVKKKVYSVKMDENIVSNEAESR